MLLDVRNVEKGFQTSEGFLPVLKGVSLSLQPAQSLALTGESGSGKSTLMTLIGALDDVDAGDIVIQGNSIIGLDDAARAQLRRETVGVVFQQFNLVPSLTVSQNLALHARLAGRMDAAFIAHLAQKLGLEGLEHRYPEDLSGGQQQRVAIGRTLAAKPKLILADEPTGNLDEATSAQVLELFVSLTQAQGTGLLMVTHSANIAAALDCQVHLKAGQIT